jgi:hypothetical protein
MKIGLIIGGVCLFLSNAFVFLYGMNPTVYYGLNSVGGLAVVVGTISKMTDDQAEKDLPAPKVKAVG